MTNYETVPPKELHEIVDYIFTKPPQDPKTIQLSLTSESADQFSTPEDRETMALEIFSTIAFMGCQKILGIEDQFSPTSLLQMSRDHRDLLQKYMNSMGVALNITCNEAGLDPWEVAESEGVAAVKTIQLSVQFM
jgi:hypothetical protein